MKPPDHSDRHPALNPIRSCGAGVKPWLPLPFRLFGKLKFIFWATLALVTSLGVAIAIPVWAGQSQVTPTTPQLGDTLTVLTQADDPTPPRVRVGSKTFPAFEIAPNRYRTLVPTTPLTKPGPLAIQVSQGGETQTLTVPLQNRRFPTQRIWLSNDSSSNSDEYEFDRMDAFKALVTPEKFWQGPLLRPNAGPTTSGYGIRRYYNGVFAKDYFHRGVDYAGPVNSPIIAPAAGKVVLVGYEARRFKVHGNCIGLDHGQGVASVFLHLNRINVKEGDFVQAGQVIGALGSTGASTGPHLHWGLYVNGQSVDPTPWRTKGFS